MNETSPQQELIRRMNIKANRDHRMLHIAYILEFSDKTKRHLIERCDRSHKAWQRAVYGIPYGIPF